TKFASVFFLRWQSCLDELAFEVAEKLLGIPSESRALASFFSPFFELLSEGGPLVVIGGGELLGAGRRYASRDRGENTNLAPLNQRRRSRLASGDATLVPAVTAELLLQGIVGAWQVSVVVTVKEAGPVATRHFDEVPQGVL